jgi:methionyl aminopeptidase
MDKLTIKNKDEVKIMAEAGAKLSRVKVGLRKAIKEKVTAADIEDLAQELIKKEGAKPSFSMVPGYHWATCININGGLVHGIPKKEIVFKKGDLVSVDVGLYYGGFHSDTSFSVAINPTKEVAHFLEVGKLALRKAIKEAKSGKRIYDISRAMEKEIKANGYSSVEALTGHGIGRKLHEDPNIPCFFTDKANLKIVPGMVLAIEVMYTQGSPELVLENDGWTISTRDGKISALYEETVAVTEHGPLVLTEG